jgi:GH43 family beta-xylosidase
MVISEDERDMVVHKSDLLTDFRNATSANIHLSNSSYDACWAPELHLINGDIYCYFSMHKIGENDHRMWVSKAVNSSDPMGLWDPPIQ